MRFQTLILALLSSAFVVGCGTTRPTGTIGVNEFSQAARMAGSSPIRLELSVVLLV